MCRCGRPVRSTAAAVAEREGSPSPADAVGPVSSLPRPLFGFTRFGRRTGQSRTPHRQPGRLASSARGRARRACPEFRPFPGRPGSYFRWRGGVFPGHAHNRAVAASSGLLSWLPHAGTYTHARGLPPPQWTHSSASHECSLEMVTSVHSAAGQRPRPELCRE